jgi:CBS domain containing-hemolysin-like protein
VTLATVFLLALMIALNALFVAAEFSIVAARPSRIQQAAEQGSGRAVRLMRTLRDPAALDRYISSCQLGITVTSIAAGAISQATLAMALQPALVDLGAVSAAMAASVAAVIVLVGMSVLQLVLGEQVPKSVALYVPDRVALGTFPTVQFTARLLRGVIWLLNGSSQGLLRLFGIRRAAQHHVHSREEIDRLIAESAEGGVVGADEHQRLRQALMLGERSLRKLMVPRPRIVAIDEASAIDDAIECALSTPYTRFPLYRGSIDHIVGFVHAKDLIGPLMAGGEPESLADLRRPVLTVHEGMTADRLIALMQERRGQMAVVLDEFGGTAGLITIEDVLAEVFGEIADEFSPQEARPERLPDGRVRLPGAMRLDEAAAFVGAPWRGDAATVGGFVVERLGKLPGRGDVLVVDGARLEIERVTRRVVESLLVEPPPPPAQEVASG